MMGLYNVLHSRRLVKMPFVELFLNLFVNLIRTLGGLDFDYFALLLKGVDDRHTCIDEGSKALLNALDVVIGPPRRLSPVQESLLHDLFRAVEEESEL